MTDHFDTPTFQAAAGGYEDGRGRYIAYDTKGHPGRVAVSFTGPQHAAMLPAAVAWEAAEQLEAQALAARSARQDTVPFALPGAGAVELSVADAGMIAEQMRVAARMSGAEGLESQQERRQRHATARALAKLGDYDPELGNAFSVAMDCLRDDWQFFSELVPRRPMSAKQLRSALGALRRGGLVTSRRNQIYGLAEYATTAEGEAWRLGGDVEDHVTTPGEEPNIDQAAHKRDRLAREHALAEEDARRDAQPR